MKKRQNILFIMTDQQRSDTIGALGNPLIRTPVLDSLVQNGTAFTNCYTPSPVCVAARSATITGIPAPSERLHRQQRIATALAKHHASPRRRGLSDAWHREDALQSPS